MKTKHRAGDWIAMKRRGAVICVECAEGLHVSPGDAEGLFYPDLVWVGEGSSRPCACGKRFQAQRK